MASSTSAESKFAKFNLTNVVAKGTKLGEGSYGTVEEYEVDGIVRAGKRIYDVLESCRDAIQTYEQECELMAKLKHANIVTFVGTTFQGTRSTTLPVLIMERLACSLHCLLENEPNIPLGLRVGLLTDVARGLSYLHGYRPPIIHRDLSGGNVLISSMLVAKISDLGNSRVVNLAPHEVANLSKKPGTTVYMPPEINPDCSLSYGPSLDVFSFGHLSLFTAIQVFPHPLLENTFKDPTISHRKLGRTEVERREMFFDLLHEDPERSHSLEQMIKECLDDNSSHRPSAAMLLSTLERMGPLLHKPSNHWAKLRLMKKLGNDKCCNTSVPNKTLSVQVDDIGGGFFIVPVANTLKEFDATTIIDFKDTILTMRQGLGSKDNIRIIFAGKQLEDHEQSGEKTTFRSYKIDPDQTLQLVLRLPGGYN